MAAHDKYGSPCENLNRKNILMWEVQSSKGTNKQFVWINRLHKTDDGTFLK